MDINFTKMGYIINYAKNYVALNYMNDPIFKRIKIGDKT